jgi:hypothetical protein
MNGYVLDPSRLVLPRSRGWQEDPYLTVGRLLRDYLGGDSLSEFRRQPRYFSPFGRTATDIDTSTDSTNAWRRGCRYALHEYPGS